MNLCPCECHVYHLHQCTQCYLFHYGEDVVTFTDSAIVDNIIEYFHRFAERGEKLGSYYYPLIKSHALQNKELIFYPHYIKFIDYLWGHRTPDEIKKLFHRAILQFVGKYSESDLARGLDEHGMIKWRIYNAK